MLGGEQNKNQVHKNSKVYSDVCSASCIGNGTNVEEISTMLDKIPKMHKMGSPSFDIDGDHTLQRCGSIKLVKFEVQLQN
jgi:hypothetical protein